MGNLYKKIFAGIYDPFMNGLEREFYHYRKELLNDIKGNVLEVGAGTGINFQFYNRNVKLLALEPSPFMKKRAELKVPDGLEVEFLNHKINDKAIEDRIEDKSLDYIVCTLVLCSIDDPNKALRKFSKWLKDDGKLIVLEHIHSENKGTKKIQDVVNPVWKKLADGCNLNRNTDVLIKQNGFEAIEERFFHSTIRFHSGVFKKVLI
jgi:ubiquinone/menaquinone biosynthesis C-methylase UbiE